MVVELGMIVPPIGMNVFVINSIAKDVSLQTIYRGVTPFILMDLIRLALLVEFSDPLAVPAVENVAHDPEKWELVFGRDHAPKIGQLPMSFGFAGAGRAFLPPR